MSMYQASIPVFIRGLRNLAALLEKGRADAEARGYAPEILLGARLAPTMFALSRQVQIATDMVKNGAARLAGIDLPSFADTETTFEELQARIARIITILDGFTEAQLQGSATRAVVVKIPDGELNFTGADYLNGFVLPNFYFHLTTAYTIMRHNGVVLGKGDFLGAI